MPTKEMYKSSSSLKGDEPFYESIVIKKPFLEMSICLILIGILMFCVSIKANSLITLFSIMLVLSYLDLLVGVINYNRQIVSKDDALNLWLFLSDTYGVYKGSDVKFLDNLDKDKAFFINKSSNRKENIYFALLQAHLSKADGIYVEPDYCFAIAVSLKP